MGDPVLGQGILQSSDNGALPYNLGKTLWSGFSGKDKIGHWQLSEIGFKRRYGNILFFCWSYDTPYRNKQKPES